MQQMTNKRYEPLFSLSSPLYSSLAISDEIAFSLRLQQYVFSLQLTGLDLVQEPAISA